MALGGLALGSLILYLKGMKIKMFQLSGFYYILKDVQELEPIILEGGSIRVCRLFLF